MAVYIQKWNLINRVSYGIIFRVTAAEYAKRFSCGPLYTWWLCVNSNVIMRVLILNTIHRVSYAACLEYHIIVASYWKLIIKLSIIFSAARASFESRIKTKILKILLCILFPFITEIILKNRSMYISHIHLRASLEFPSGDKCDSWDSRAIYTAYTPSLAFTRDKRFSSLAHRTLRLWCRLRVYSSVTISSSEVGGDQSYGSLYTAESANFTNLWRDIYFSP